MISNLSDSIKMTFPSNVENLCILMMDKLDQNKMQLQNQIKGVLDRLVEESIIREEKGKYFFFNEDEIDVQNFIKNQAIGMEDRWNEFDVFFRRLVNLNFTKFSFANNDFKVSYWIDDKEIFRNGDFRIKVLFSDKSELHQKALMNANSDIMVAVAQWFREDQELIRDFDWYVKTSKYFSFNAEAASGERMKTMENFRVRNEALKEKIARRLEMRFSETDYVLGQKVVDASEINGTQPAERFRNAISKHLEKVYHKHKASERYAKNQQELRDIIKNPVQADLGLDTAEMEINDWITAHGDEVTVDDIIKAFEKPPFGWKFEAVLHVLYNLEGKKKREFVYQNSPRYAAKTFIELAMKTNERAVCVVKAGEEIPQSTIDETRDLFKAIFNSEIPITTNGNELSDLIKAKLDKLYQDYEKDEEVFYGSYPFGNVFHQVRKKIEAIKTIREPKSLFRRLQDEKDELKESYDLAKGMADIMSRAKGDYDAISEFYKNNKDNIRELSPESIEKGDKIALFLKSEDPRFELRHILKAYKELKEDIKSWMNDLKEEVVGMYQVAFQELDQQAKNMGVEANIYADESTILKKIRNSQSITQLKLMKSEVGRFKVEELDKIIRFASQKENTSGSDSKVNEPEVYYITNVKATISTEEELEAYIQKVKADMQALLKSNKTIIIK